MPITAGAALATTFGIEAGGPQNEHLVEAAHDALQSVILAATAVRAGMQHQERNAELLADLDHVVRAHDVDFLDGRVLLEPNVDE